MKITKTLRTLVVFTGIVILMCLLSTGLTAAEEKPAPPGTGEIVIGKTEAFYSNILNEWRILEIYMPGGYERDEQKYPLLVILDGGDLFAYMVSFIEMMAPNDFPKMAVIAIRNTDRYRDLDVRKGLNDNIKRFYRFLEEEFLPYAEKKYRTLPYRILAGHSLAGAFTLFTLFKNTGLFNNYIATSPSIGEPEVREMLSGVIQSVPVEGLKKRYLYITAGGEEPMELHQALQDIDKQFKARQFHQFKWDTSIFEKEGHVPIKGFYQGLRNVFANWAPPLKVLLNGSVEELKTHYNGLSKKYGFEVAPASTIIVTVGRQHMRKKRVKEAIKIFEYYITVYPKAVFGRFLLVQAYLDDGQIDKAKKTLKKVLTLSPGNKRAREWLDSLKK